MKFSELRWPLKTYIGLNGVLLVPIAWLAWRQPPPESWPTVAGLLLFTVLFSTWKVELTILQAKMTLTFAVVCLALLLQGMVAAVLCAMVGAILGTYLRPSRQGWKVEVVYPPLHRGLFNIGNCALACTLSALAYTYVTRFSPREDVYVVVALGVFTSSYYLINTLGVSLAIAFQHRQPWASVWQQNFLWTAPGYFASASAAAGIQLVSQRIGPWALMFLPWLYVIYYSYRLYMERLHKDMAHITELNRLNQAVIASLATAIDAKDRSTSSHITRVQQYGLSLARAAGVTGPDLDAVATGALVHDIGKLGIPDHILLKPGKLAPDEFRRIQSHVDIGAEILAPVPFSFPVVDVVKSHHERWDGLGYPNGLKGEDIPIGGRIIAIVDVFDALTSDRPYRRAMSCDEAASVLREAAGKQFDPRLVSVFLKILPQVWREVEATEAEMRQQREELKSREEGRSALAQIGQAAAEMAAVSHVAQALAEQTSLEEIYRVVVERARQLVPGDTAVLYIREPNETMLQAVQVDGKYSERLRGMTIHLGEGSAGWVAENQQPKVNVSAALDVARRFGPEENLDLSAATAVPLVHGPDNLGVLAVYTTAYSVLSEHHLHVLNILAEHAASAIQNHRRFEQHRELAFTDPLTGLANSRCLFRHLDRLTRAAGSAEERSGPFSLVMLDLDCFKEVNDRLGHVRGDELLRLVAELLSQIGRADDVVCRYAGDEFVVLLPRTTREHADRVADRVRVAIDGVLPIEGQVRIGASVGVATYGEDGWDATSLINVADRRMYENKFERRRQRSAGRKDRPDALLASRT